MSIDSGRWKCVECDWIGKDYLTAPSPFDQDDMLVACPDCKTVHSLVDLCDQFGCKLEATCGWPTKAGGYRRTCFAHSNFASKP